LSQCFTLPLKFRDLAVSSIWALRRRTRSVAADAKSWLLLSKNSVWGRRYPNARMPRTSIHLSQCCTLPLKSIPASCFPHAPCPPSWIPSLPSMLTPVLCMRHLFKTTYATLGACLSTDPIWWSDFLRRGKPGP
jgi:hypothetical protein